MNIVFKTEHGCEYRLDLRLTERKYDSTNTLVVQTSYVSVKTCLVCGKLKPRTPTHKYVSIRTNYDANLILGYEIMQEGDVCLERPVTCDWMDYVPEGGKEDFLCIRMSKIKETNCTFKQCSVLKTYVDFAVNRY